ncbi:MAG: sugar-binding protein [Ignavibacteria bacterium]
MNSRFISIISAAVLLLVSVTSMSFADTLTVYANGPTLDAVIGSDTTSGGEQAHDVYKLVSRDTTYIFDATITIKSSVEIIGVLGSDGRPPCIQPDVLSDNSVPGLLFTFLGTGTTVKIKDLYLLGISINNTVNYGGGQAIQISADNIRLIVDNVVFENWSQFAIGYSANWNKFYITNCKFRNMTTQPNQWYVGELLRNENYLGAFKTDTIIIKYNTMLCVSGYATAATGGIVNYYEFSHNNIIYTFKNPFFLDRMVNAKFNNNIFYNVYAGGQNLTEFNGGWDSFTAGTVASIITMGPLDSTTAADLLGHPSTGAGDPAAELLRKVEVKNNAYYWSDGLTSFWTAWNDTAHVDTIITPVFMNQQSIDMFSNDTNWPGFVESGNLNVDPVYGPSVNEVLDPGTNGNVGLLNWFTVVRTGTGTTELYGYKITQVDFSSGNWIPDWPLLEAADMQYTNTDLHTGATDGGYVGDPNWFGPVEPLIVVDGQKDDFYNTLTGPDDGYLQITSCAWNDNGRPTDDADLSTKVWAAWDADWFYLYQEVMDDNISNGTTTNVWEVDNMELKFDAIPTPSDTVTNTIWDTRLTAPGMTPGDSLTTNISDPNNKQFSRHLVTGGYVAELAIRWSAIGSTEKITPEIDNTFGLAINQHDNDGAARVASVEWASVMLDAVWNTPKYLGTVKFLAGGKLQFIPQSSVTPWRVNTIVPYDGSECTRTGVDDGKSLLPKEYGLSQNYPNPFNPSTVINFALPKQAAVELAVYNLLGEKVAQVINQEMNAGYHSVTFDASALPSGIYFYRINAGSFTQTKKLMLLK